VPATVTVYCPTVAELDAVNVRVLFPVVGLGEKDAVTPLGSVEVIASATLPVNPYCGYR